MADDRTPEQRTADDALDAAVQAVVAAYGPGYVSGWVLAAAITDADADGPLSGVSLHYPDGWLPWTLALGIVEGARLKLRSDFNATD